MKLTISRFDSPVDRLSLASDDQGQLRGICWSNEGLIKAMRREYLGIEFAEGDTPDAILSGLGAYFSGDLSALIRIPWSLEDAQAGNGFQARVWRALADIPAGQTISYGEMAQCAGEPGAAQAAGVALNRNPIAVVLPCHRVVGAANSSGRWAMVGFGGGLERKTWLLRHEGALLI